MPACPVRWGAAPETPNFGSAQSDLEPVMRNEQEVARSFPQLLEVILEGDVPPEDIAEYFGWELVDV